MIPEIDQTTLPTLRRTPARLKKKGRPPPAVFSGTRRYLGGQTAAAAPWFAVGKRWQRVEMRARAKGKFLNLVFLCERRISKNEGIF